MILPIIIIVTYVSWKIYECYYYKSTMFKIIKDNVSNYIDECNLLNEHIETLKQTHIGYNCLDFGTAQYYDNSIYNYTRPQYRNIKFEPYIYNCSRTVCDNARKQPFKYICKYFNIKATEENLNHWESVLNNYNAVEQGKTFLMNKKHDILFGIKSNIPFLIRCLSKKKLEKKLGFHAVDLQSIYFPTYYFNYVSSGGYASTGCKITLDLANLDRFIVYLSQIVKFKKSVQGQRALMTTQLRKDILKRDNYTCQYCGNSIYKEPNLLLEVDHIMPLSKGGITSVTNLQTLCWKCNRTKSNKIESLKYNPQYRQDI